MYKIRLAEKEDKNSILKIYKNARKFMIRNGNPNQWGESYPKEETINTDLEEHKFLYVVEMGKEIIGVFYFRIGTDQTYLNIEGKWKDESEYGVIHRIASSGKVSHFFEIVLLFCLNKIKHIRIDTHKDNKVMLNCLQRTGFIHTGTIICDKGTPREAFELIK